MRRVLVLLLIAAPLFAEDLINADRPGIADSSATIAPHSFQIELGVQRDDAVLSTPLLLRYGLSDALELRVETEGEDHELTPASIGAKWRFAENFAVIGRYFSDDEPADLRLSADFELDDHWSLNPNIGIDDERTLTAAATLQYTFNERFNAFVDGGLDGSTLLLDAGTAYIIGRDTQLDFSAGWGARGSDAPDWFVSAGLSRRFRMP